VVCALTTLFKMIRQRYSPMWTLVPELIAVSRQSTHRWLSHKLSGSCHYFAPGSQLPFQSQCVSSPFARYQITLLGWRRHEQLSQSHYTAGSRDVL